MKSGAGIMDEVTKVLHYDEVPTMVGGGNDDDDVGSIIDSVVEELSQVTFSEGMAGGDSVEWGTIIAQELKSAQISLLL